MMYGWTIMVLRCMVYIVEYVLTNSNLKFSMTALEF